jgi:dihydroorotate dehydrogenase electron transfer subunit
MKAGSAFIEQALILENKNLSADVYQMVINAPKISAVCVPGQFVMVKVTGLTDPLLRRPLSIAGAAPEQERITLIYRVIGRGTEQMGILPPGSLLDIMGPLGHGFDLTPHRLLLVGGGMGLAPLSFAAARYCPRPVEVLAGGRTEKDLFWNELFQDRCEKLHVATDDGSLGFCGTCVDFLPNLLRKSNFGGVLTCGPRAMMKRVVELAAHAGVPTQVSLEEHMACGLGACLSCTWSSSDGTSRQVCKDGPVFGADEVDWS